MTQIIRDLNTWQNYRKNLSHAEKIGFVPTMGNLHEGHASLLRRSVQENTQTVLSIFVNPTQFNDQNDLANYPRTEAQDIALAEALKVDAVLIPSMELMYPHGYRYQVQENNISQYLEGELRPGHFTGMLTVVLKLLQLVRATHAYFGEKDYQQLLLVQGLVEDFFIDTKIVPCPTVRLPEGLPMSSRNSRLSPEDLQHAHHFSKILQQNIPLPEIKQQLINQGFEVEYLEEQFNRRLCAVKFKNVRLLDNVY
ncbi:MAG TPA: pantoate--beta-alanine ligase [Gammaproteobacteria bacterium]|nr:pantoate--beta-alanine ligase [Gammaproteobacteria bacterium]